MSLNPTHPASSPRLKAFTLVELLTTMAIIAVVTGLAMAAVSSMRGTPARHGASRAILSTLESARVLAIETGRTTVVAFANGHDSSGQGDHESYYGVFKDGGTTQVGTWRTLPDTLVFTQGAGTETLMDQVSLTYPFSLPGTGNSSPLPAIAFNRLGQIISPLSSTGPSLTHGGPLWIGISHGFSDNSNSPPLYTEADSAGQPTSDFIILSRYTGRGKLVE